MKSWFDKLKEFVSISIASICLILVTLGPFYSEFNDKTYFWLFALALQLISMIAICWENKYGE